MSSRLIVVAALLLCGVGPAQAVDGIGKQFASRGDPMSGGRQPATALSVGYRTEPDATRGRIAVCADLAAARALDAKVTGAGYAVQDRVLDFTFVLCMTGPPTAD